MSTKKTLGKRGSLSTDIVSSLRLKTVICEKCNYRSVVVDANAIAGTCFICTCSLVPFDDLSTNNRPRGWKFMKTFVDVSGTVYNYGEEVPELFGTLPATDVDEIRKRTKENQEAKKIQKKELEKKKEAELLLINEKQKEAKKNKTNSVVQDILQQDMSSRKKRRKTSTTVQSTPKSKPKIKPKPKIKTKTKSKKVR